MSIGWFPYGGPRWGSGGSNSWVTSAPVQASVLVLLLAGAAWLEGRAGTAEGSTDDAGPDHPTLPEFAGAASVAADALADDAGRDEVYAAWLSMLRSLSLRDPESCSPERFAREVEAVGLAPEDVGALGEVFEVGRYGGAATDERRRRAVETLRRVADRYGEEADGDGDGGD